MNTKQSKQYYTALLAKDSSFEGIFFVGVKTTGVFCRPTCPARKPKFENCEFFHTAQDALLASYRPCKRCQPLSSNHAISHVIQQLLLEVEKNPHKRWKTLDFKKLSIDESTARRHFKKRFGMTFVAYARARRMGIALQNIRTGNSIIDTQQQMGYQSSSGFRDAFSSIMGTPPTQSQKLNILHATWIDTPLGPMIAIANHQKLFLLEFVDRRGLEKEIQRLRSKTKSVILPGTTPPLQSVKKELKAYFAGKLTHFTTDLEYVGTPFQWIVWDALLKIPIGQTCSYSDLARRIGRPTAARAVAQANGMNQIAILIPCHRIIDTNGDLGGYGGGIARKQWLLQHEHSLALPPPTY